MARKLRFGNVILCEHAAMGAGNRHILVNTYSGDVVVQSFPAKLLFGIYIEPIPDAEDPLDMSLSLRLNGEEFGNLSAQLIGHKPGKPSVLVLSHLEIGLGEEAEFTIVATATGYRTSTVLKKRIYKGESQG